MRGGSMGMRYKTEGMEGGKGCDERRWSARKRRVLTAPSARWSRPIHASMHPGWHDGVREPTTRLNLPCVLHLFISSRDSVPSRLLKTRAGTACLGTGLLEIWRDNGQSVSRRWYVRNEETRGSAWQMRDAGREVADVPGPGASATMTFRGRGTTEASRMTTVTEIDPG
jgi:hypothetical protein